MRVRPVTPACRSAADGSSTKLQPCPRTAGLHKEIIHTWSPRRLLTSELMHPPKWENYVLPTDSLRPNVWRLFHHFMPFFVFVHFNFLAAACKLIHVSRKVSNQIHIIRITPLIIIIKLLLLLLLTWSLGFAHLCGSLKLNVAYKNILEHWMGFSALSEHQHAHTHTPHTPSCLRC